MTSDPTLAVTPDGTSQNRTVASSSAAGPRTLHSSPTADRVEPNNLLELPLGAGPRAAREVGRRWVNLLLMIALLGTLPFWLFGMSQWVLLTGATWIVVGARAAWTGLAPVGLGGAVYHPKRYRILGVIFALMGIVLIVPWSSHPSLSKDRGSPRTVAIPANKGNVP